MIKAEQEARQDEAPSAESAVQAYTSMVHLSLRGDWMDDRTRRKRLPYGPRATIEGLLTLPAEHHVIRAGAAVNKVAAYLPNLGSVAAKTVITAHDYTMLVATDRMSTGAPKKCWECAFL